MFPSIWTRHYQYARSAGTATTMKWQPTLLRGRRIPQLGDGRYPPDRNTLCVLCVLCVVWVVVVVVVVMVSDLRLTTCPNSG